MIVEGMLRQRSFETKDGEKRTVVELDVDEIGASLRYATVRISRTIADGNRRESGEHHAAAEKPRQATASTRPVAVATAAAADDDF